MKRDQDFYCVLIGDGDDSFNVVQKSFAIRAPVRMESIIAALSVSFESVPVKAQADDINTILVKTGKISN